MQIMADGSGRLYARPKATVEFLQTPRISPGIGAAVGVTTGSRDGWLYIPRTYSPATPSPLVVMLHGAGGRGRGNTTETFGESYNLDHRGVILFCPDSRGSSWDVIQGGLGPDVRYIDQALTTIFKEYNVDDKRVGIAGFSDGASYALTLGLANGDVFTHIMAFSPGFMKPPCQIGVPRIYVSHGVYDTVLHIDHCSRRLVPRLEQAGYELVYKEFHGPHTVPVQLSVEALDWFLDVAKDENENSVCHEQA